MEKSDNKTGASSVCLVGDFCLSGMDMEKGSRVLQDNPWSALRMILGEDAIIVANLECPFTVEQNGMPFKWANLKASPMLHGAIDGLSIAVLGNNHIGDFFLRGALDTKDLLDRKGIQSAGFGATLRDALQPALRECNGKTLGVVSLCCPTTNSENLATHLLPGVAPLGMATLKDAIDGARPQCDALVVYLHWGCEWVHDPAPDQLRLARHAIDCGADAVIGCHSHTIQSYERYRGRWIFYGLGNYLFKAGEAQMVIDRGEIKKIPLTLQPENRESLAVTFQIVPDIGSGRLRLKRVQPMRFEDDLVPHPISFSSLTLDMDAANERLWKYASTHGKELDCRDEPIFLAKLRNGILAYWYSQESLQSGPTKKNLFRETLARMKDCIFR